MSYDRPEHPDALDELVDPHDVPGAVERRAPMTFADYLASLKRRQHRIDWVHTGGAVEVLR